MAKIINEIVFTDEVLHSDMPVMVDFFADWCVPCKAIAPFVEEISEELEGKAKVFKINTDEAMNLAREYEIRSIPTILYFKGGQMVDRVTGGYPKEILKQKLEGLL